MPPSSLFFPSFPSFLPTSSPSFFLLFSNQGPSFSPSSEPRKGGDSGPVFLPLPLFFPRSRVLLHVLQFRSSTGVLPYSRRTGSKFRGRCRNRAFPRFRFHLPRQKAWICKVWNPLAIEELRFGVFGGLGCGGCAPKPLRGLGGLFCQFRPSLLLSFSPSSLPCAYGPAGPKPQRSKALRVRSRTGSGPYRSV